jgi:hypothetical protein
VRCFSWVGGVGYEPYFESWPGGRLRFEPGFIADPGMDSNHELDKILKTHNLLILRSHRSHRKQQKQGLGTKSVQKSIERLQCVSPR